MTDPAEELREAAIVRDYFEALLDGCRVVAVTDTEAGRSLLTSMRVALDGQADLIRSALVADSADLVDLGLKPMAVVPCRGGELTLYRPVRALEAR